ncbi:MAG: chromosome segregation protein SMC [Bacillaceae bacterium]
MYLKRLDIVGFKSFADRISLEFKQGVTAVVGPNGSGKSNIIDAIRWVLGEQSAKSLRGGKMEDVIFAGCDSRKALNVADVTLTLDNEDGRLPLAYNEISVTRRVYRSGESEFFINKQHCRLKDIVELFMDSGLGKEAFSIISQGKVEEILSSKAEERRSIFEEAAGVLKYKTRKRKAEQKLNETQDNLNRVEDILYELESQIEPLRMQSEIAKEYLEKKEELESVEGALIVYEIEELHEKWEHLSKEFEVHKQEEVTLTTALSKKESKVAQHRDEMVALDESISQLQEVLLVATKEIEKIDGQKQLIRERRNNSKKYFNQLQQQIAENTELKENAILSQQDEQQQLKQIKQQLKEVMTQLKEKEEFLASIGQNIEEALEALKSEYIERLNERASNRNEFNLLQQQADSDSQKSERLDLENDRYLSMRKELSATKEAMVDDVASVQKEVDRLSEEATKRTKHIAALKEMYREKEAQLYKAYHYVQKAQSRKEMLDAMQEDFSGFYQGVREVLKARETELEGIVGAVAELITVPQEIEVAIETALGAGMQHVVVENEQFASKAIGFLKRNQYGRATFLPRNIIKSRELPLDIFHRAKNNPGFIGIGSNLVQFEKANENIVKNLLGNIIVAKTLKDANAIAKDIAYRYRIVTLEGDVVNPGGSMTGGASKTSKSSLLSRQRELEELVEKLAYMQEKTKETEEEVSSIKKQISTEEGNVDALKGKFEQQRLHLQEKENGLQKIELELKSVNDRLSLYDFEMAGNLKESTRKQERMATLEREMESLTTTIDDLNKQIESLTKQKTQEHVSKEELSQQITALKVKVASQEQVIQNKEERIRSIKEEIQKYEQQITAAKEEISILHSNILNNDVSEESLQEEYDRKEGERRVTIELISTRREQRFSLGETLETIENELKETKRQHKYLFELLKEEEVKINRLDVELDNRLNHLRETYQLSFEAAKEKFFLSISIEEAKKRVKLIKRTIEELGTVNIGAIEEYERVKERHDFLASQQSDLTEAKETLYQVIGEMDEEMKKRFEYTFYAIKAEFKQVFTELFGGGRADLILVNPDDLLNTGVEIVAQPLGKKLQNLSLLSGGERALTAIALLFAILRVRPVPFCILDEVEAALDEANVVRYANYLKKFSNETQFIVITHRKGTMEECDLLYGVTMQESGVSKIVSVRLDEVTDKVVN